MRIDLLLITALLLAPSLASASEDPGPWHTDLALAVRLADTEPRKPIALLFSSESCVWCHRMLQDTGNHEGSQQILQQVVGVVVDVNAYPAVAAQFGVRAFPTLVLINRKRQWIRTVPGYLPPDDLVTTLRVLALRGDEDGGEQVALLEDEALAVALSANNPDAALLALLGHGGALQRGQLRDELRRRRNTEARLWDALTADELGVRVDASAVLAEWYGRPEQYDAFAAPDLRKQAAAQWQDAVASRSGDANAVP
ncbi:MAG: thioredoxin fold domain-containing protein [Planctomycetota bacterium]|jgi:thioredoxin-related protein|nr:thioredoxin fold domain-containing protein [Planctomycetota bacterium]